MRILRAKDRVATPWKNGGGTTSEVIAFPPGAGFDDFGWRVSIARVETSGPFSKFSGIHRHLAMLKGCVRLKIAGRETLELSPETQPVNFPGDVPTEAEMIDGAATDLNVMTRHGQFSATMLRRTVSAQIRTSAETTLLFPLSDTAVRADNRQHALSLGDAILAGVGEEFAIAPAAQCYWIEINGG